MNTTKIEVSGRNYESLLSLLNSSIMENKKVAVVGGVRTGKTVLLGVVEKLLMENGIPYIKHNGLEESLPESFPTDSVLIIDHPRMTMTEMWQYSDLNKQEKAIFAVGYDNTEPTLKNFDIRIDTYNLKDTHLCYIFK